MADIKRSLAELLTLFEDGQASNSITEQDLRDLIVSFTMPHGTTKQTNNASATVINTIGTFELLAGTFVGGGGPTDFTESATNGKLTYTGAPDRHMHVVSNFSFTCASNNQTLEFQWFKNGVAVSPPIERRVGTGSDIGAVSLHIDTVMSTNDMLELKITNKTSTASITCKHVYLFVMGMME